MGDSPNQDTRRSVSPGTEIDAIGDRFEAAWLAGEEPRIEDYLGRVSSKKGADTPRQFLLELVMIDLEHRWRRAARRFEQESGQTDQSTQPDAGETVHAEAPLLEQYAERFPVMGPARQMPDEVIAFEYRVRHLWGDRPSRQSFESRFPHHTPALLERLAAIDSELSSCQAHGIGR